VPYVEIGLGGGRRSARVPDHLHPRPRHRHRPETLRADLRDLPTSVHPRTVSRHGDRALVVQEDRGARRGSDLGRIPPRRGHSLSVHAPGGFLTPPARLRPRATPCPRSCLVCARC
jgi:hypothetical protein